MYKSAYHREEQKLNTNDDFVIKQPIIKQK